MVKVFIKASVYHSLFTILKTTASIFVLFWVNSGSVKVSLCKIQSSQVYLTEVDVFVLKSKEVTRHLCLSWNEACYGFRKKKPVQSFYFTRLQDLIRLCVHFLSACCRVFVIRTILLSVISLLNEPNTFSPANVDASVMFRKWRDSKGKDKEYAEIIR